MVKSVLLLVGLCGVLAGCSWVSGDGGSSVPGSGWTAYPVYKFRVPNGTTRSYPRAALDYPLTVGCPKPKGSTRRGFHQVIRSPIRNGLTFFGDSTNGTSLTITAHPTGRIEFTCS
jgi:hypothetical protein